MKIKFEFLKSGGWLRINSRCFYYRIDRKQFKFFSERHGYSKCIFIGPLGLGVSPINATPLDVDRHTKPRLRVVK